MLDEVSSVLRQWDRPRYLALLFAPDAYRGDLVALHAFGAEVSRIPLIVSDPQLGLIRFQWWRDALAAMAQGKSLDHPVACAVAAAIIAHGLPLRALQEFLDAHEQVHFAAVPQDVRAWEEYLGKTSSILIQLSAMILDRTSASSVAEVAGLAGVAYGAAQIVSDANRSVNLIANDDNRASLAALSRKRLLEARSLTVPSGLFPAFLHVSLTELFLAQVGKPPPQWRMQWRLWNAARQERF